jgi:hypothetical protein
MILALGHKARHGKDTAGEAIVEFYNSRREVVERHNMLSTSRTEELYPKAKIFKFADELYRVCREQYGMTEKNPTLLQKIGDGRRREFGLDYWIKQLEPKIKAFKGVAVITDVRYINEADWVKSLGGHTINVRRLNQDGTPFIANDRDPNFISETQLDGYNYDHYIITKSATETAEIAITISEYLKALELK